MIYDKHIQKIWDSCAEGKKTEYGEVRTLKTEFGSVVLTHPTEDRDTWYIKLDVERKEGDFKPGTYTAVCEVNGAILPGLYRFSVSFGGEDYMAKCASREFMDHFDRQFRRTLNNVIATHCP